MAKFVCKLSQVSSYREGLINFKNHQLQYLDLMFIKFCKRIILNKNLKNLKKLKKKIYAK